MSGTVKFDYGNAHLCVIILGRKYIRFFTKFENAVFALFCGATQKPKEPNAFRKSCCL